MTDTRITVAHSPDSDDAFMFYGLASGSVETGGIVVDQVLADIETLNRAAFEGRCPECVETLEMFVSAYGAEAGNLALRTVATAGLYVGGGIAPKMLPLLESGLFLEAFRAKEPMAALVATVPVAVILNPDAGLLGAAVHAASISSPAW